MDLRGRESEVLRHLVWLGGAEGVVVLGTH